MLEARAHLITAVGEQEEERSSSAVSRQVLEEFTRVWPEFTATVGVQEPFAGTIRFKWLARLPSAEMGSFLDDPMGYLSDRYGGGKFKMNLHHGLHFVNTKNFKPEGEPRWRDAPELVLD